MSGPSDSRQWDRAASRAGGYYLPPALAEYKFGEYRRLLDGWGIGPCRRALLTDVYDSSFGSKGLAGMLAERAGEVIALDISPAFSRKAKATLGGDRSRVMLLAGDARRLPLAEGSMDLVLSPSTFDHFPEIEAALAECRRVLRPGGRLVLALNSADNPLYRLGVRLAERFKRREYPTDFFYTRRQVQGLLARAGFKAGRTTAIMHAPVGLTTAAEALAGLGAPPGGVANRALVGLCRRLGRAGGRAPGLTGWWLAAEGIK